MHGYQYIDFFNCMYSNENALYLKHLMYHQQKFFGLFELRQINLLKNNKSVDSFCSLLNKTQPIKVLEIN